MEGIPSSHLLHQLDQPSRSGKRTIDLSLLRQAPPLEYLLDSGDVLGIYVEGVLGRREEVPPVHFPLNEGVAPSLGYPIPVRADGTISLPLIEPLYVRGHSVRQVEEMIRQAYTLDRHILLAGRDRILVSLQRPRTYRVLVIRQEAGVDLVGGNLTPGTLNVGALKRGTGRAVDLPAYKNDVLHALAETGGLPGLDAENVIYVIRCERGPGAGIPAMPTPAPLLAPPPAPMPLDQSVQRDIRGFSPNGGPNPPGLSPEVPVESDEDAGRQPDETTINPDQQDGEKSRANTPLPLELPDPWPIQQTAAFVEAESPPTPARTVPPASPWGHRLGSGASRAPATGAPSGRYAPTAGSHPVRRRQPIAQTGGRYGNSYGNSIVEGPYPAVRGPVAVDPYANSRVYATTPVEMYAPTIENPRVVKIPVRLGPGDFPMFAPQDVVLQDGDIVFIESRDTEIFYTGGLLGGGQYTLPRDYDLDVLGAISIAQSQVQGTRGARAIGGVSALNQDVTVSASDVVILRKQPDGTQLPIKVNLYDAMRHPEERVVIQPGDYIILQYTRAEAVAAFVERHLLEGALFGVAAAQFTRN